MIMSKWTQKKYVNKNSVKRGVEVFHFKQQNRDRDSTPEEHCLSLLQKQKNDGIDWLIERSLQISLNLLLRINLIQKTEHY